jgi:hypothetical protein
MYAKNRRLLSSHPATEQPKALFFPRSRAAQRHHKVRGAASSMSQTCQSILGLVGPYPIALIR